MGRPCEGVYAARKIHVWPASSTIDVMLSTNEGGQHDAQLLKIPHWAIRTITSLPFVVVSSAEAVRLLSRNVLPVATPSSLMPGATAETCGT